MKDTCLVLVSFILSRAVNWSVFCD